MIILHAGAVDDNLLLWGEMSIEDGGSSTSPRRGRAEGAPPRSYPFDAGFRGLSSALKAAGVHVKIRNKRMRLAIAWIPTRGSKPLASSPLIAEAPRSRAKVRLAPWVVTALPLAPEKTVDLLSVSANRQTLAPGVVVGPDLAFWTTALHFAWALGITINFKFIAKKLGLVKTAGQSVHKGEAPQSEPVPLSQKDRLREQIEASKYEEMK